MVYLKSQRPYTNCHYKIFKYLDDLNYELDSAEYNNLNDKSLNSLRGINILSKASELGITRLAQLMVNRFASYDESLSLAIKNARHNAAILAARGKHVQLVKWYLEKGEKLDNDLLKTCLTT